MANPARSLPQNVSGDFYVDETCIDCDTCRQIAPASFHDHGDQSSVYRQPQNEAETKLALMALVACPTASIGTHNKENIRQGIDAFPSLLTDDIYFCGFTSESSFGAWSYLILRPENRGGNILIDSPRYASQLLKRLDTLGGVRTMLLSHIDDVADHASYAKRYGCTRVMHAADGAGRLGVERVIQGEEVVQLDEELKIIPTPGHTRGHMVFLYKDRYLFTGDHLAWSPNRETLTAFRSVSWYSWPEQTRSMERLLHYTFEWVLPGHGRIHHDSPAAMRVHLENCIAWMKER